MNLLLFDPSQLTAAQTATATARQARHLRDVLGARPDSTLRAGLIGGPRGTATVVRCDEAGAELALSLCDPPSPRPPVDLILAVPRPKVGRRVLQTAASMGVGRIDLVNAWRVDKSYFDSPMYQPEAIRDALVLGCEQGQTTWLPETTLHRRLMGFLESEAGAEANRAEASGPPGPAPRRVVAHPGATADLEAAISGPNDHGRVAIAIGPEGGWIARELETFSQRGYELVWLSDRTLRVESAVVAALSQLELVRRRRVAPQ